MKRLPIILLLFCAYFICDAQAIRQKDRWGETLYYVDGNTLRQRDRWGAQLYYFECVPEKWILAVLLLM